MSSCLPDLNLSFSKDIRLFGEMLHMFAIVSTKSGSSCLMICYVGAGSSRQCFESGTPMIFEISSTNTGLSPDRVRICFFGSITVLVMRCPVMPTNIMANPET